MQLPTIPKTGRLSRKHKITAAGAAAAAAMVLTVTGLQATGGAAVAAGDPTGFSVSTGEQVKSLDAQAGLASQRAIADAAAAKKQAVADAAAQKKAEARAAAAAAAAAKQQAAARAQVKAQARAQVKARARAQARAEARAEARRQAAADAAERERAREAASRARQRAALAAKAAVQKSVNSSRVTTRQVAAPVAKAYTNNLDGWIRESLDIMAAHKIPGSYHGIYRNIIRESSGNPNAINLWDINARNGIPSKGLLQVIDPTFQTYHVQGTSWNIYNPVANITAACNYAYHRYGSMDNVNSAY
jgi:Transglycosylase SLT domain